MSNVSLLRCRSWGENWNIMTRNFMVQEIQVCALFLYRIISFIITWYKVSSYIFMFTCWPALPRLLETWARPLLASMLAGRDDGDDYHCAQWTIFNLHPFISVQNSCIYISQFIIDQSRYQIQTLKFNWRFCREIMC